MLLARSGPDPARVRDQNFGSPHAELPLSVYHFPMVNDVARNNAFAAAITKAVCKIRPELVVDIGSGTGLLAMLAAKAGAPRVLAIEMTPELATIAQGLVESHGYVQQVRVMACHSSRVHLDPTLDPTYDPELPRLADPWERRADLLVFEILGTDPLCEGLLPALRDARARLLSPTATILPCALEVHAALIESDELMRLNAVSGEVSGIDLSALNQLSHRTRAVRLNDLRHVMLTKPVTALRLNLDGDEPPATEGEVEVELQVEHSGKAHAVIAWFTASLDRDERRPIAVCTAPGVAEPMRGYSWGQSAHFLPGTEVHANETLRLCTGWTDKGLTFEVAMPTNRGGDDAARAHVGRQVATEGLTRELLQKKKQAEEDARKEEEYRKRFGLPARNAPPKQRKSVAVLGAMAPQEEASEKGVFHKDGTQRWVSDGGDQEAHATPRESQLVGVGKSPMRRSSVRIPGSPANR